MKKIILTACVFLGFLFVSQAQQKSGEIYEHNIGERYGGGIVFYVYDNGQHGLIAATADQNTGISWNTGIGSNSYANPARNDGLGIGRSNTDFIIAKQGQGILYAAFICARYAGSGYSDWYLPSKYELNLLYLQKNVVGGFARDYYWSSSEFDNTAAWRQDFGIGLQSTLLKAYVTCRVRAVRAF